jgi:hypothetical protein
MAEPVVKAKTGAEAVPVGMGRIPTPATTMGVGPNRTTARTEAGEEMEEPEGAGATVEAAQVAPSSVY